uniref:ARAD1D11154p n=1 Tax=Blastobotrys adeninivorans TaxID=409370 RepID=A0A060T8Y2_BLAAD
MGKKNFTRRDKKPRSRAPVTDWTPIEKENQNWERYYRESGLIPEGEFEKFKESCQTVLPLTFRFTGHSQHAKQILKSLEDDYIPYVKNITFDGQPIEPPTPIKFYPDKLAWQMKAGKQVIRKNVEFSRLQRFLVVETEVGNISRQEAVSMIPPLLLDVQPHHSVIDLCAAPGSKTAQIVEFLHKDPQPTGLVVANDSDYKRSHLLIHQLKRLNTPNLIVTNHDAQLFPRIRSETDGEYLKFDRVLCDVPCSGDGTMRKNVNVWKDWTVGNALGLHPTQVNILARGLQLLKPGGRLVYSTCSLNPIENEAVVAEALRQNKGLVSLVDVSDQLPELVRSPGVSNWKVMGKDKEWKEPGDAGAGPRSLFPPSEEEDFNLDRCIRVYPHQQDTGGFFICVFEKKEKPKRAGSPIEQPAKKAKVEEEPKTEDSTPVPESAAPASDAADAPKPAELGDDKKKLPRNVPAVDDPFKFLAPEHPELERCWDFYGIEKFPRDTMLVRNMSGEPVRTIYYVAPSVKPILQLNEDRLKFVHAGIKMFAQQKSEGACKWRVQSEGIDLLFPYATKRVVKASSADAVKKMCEVQFPKFDELKEIDAALAEQTLALAEGCAFLRVPTGSSIEQELVFPMWRGKGSSNLMLSKQDTQELLHRLFGVENVKGDRSKTASASQTPAQSTEQSAEQSEEPEATPAQA